MKLSANSSIEITDEMLKQIEDNANKELAIEKIMKQTPKVAESLLVKTEEQEECLKVIREMQNQIRYELYKESVKCPKYY
ncbi:MAG: hypothetical protein ACM34O_15880 [Ignavibacteria bacterium]